MQENLRVEGWQRLGQADGNRQIRLSPSMTKIFFSFIHPSVSEKSHFKHNLHIWLLVTRQLS